MKTNTSSLNLSKQVDEIFERLPDQEHTLCKGLNQPFNATNSGSRKIMQGIQMEQACQINDGEVPIISTGYEDAFGEFSSNFIREDRKYVVVGKISKFSSKPNIHYWLILLDPENDELTCIERYAYKHITEFYGYLYDNEYLDSLEVGSEINDGDVVKKTISYDEYNNRTGGLNLTTMYIASELVKEDPIVISESAAKRFTSPFINCVEVKINDNDILLNLYGEGKEYKTFPNIGEEIKNSILCAVRRELKDEEALYTQSWDRLKSILMSDKKYLTEGEVIDIDVYCNNPEKIENSMYNQQIKIYYDQTKKFAKEFVDTIDQLMGDKKRFKLSYELQSQYYTSSMVVQGKQFISDKVFNNIVMVIYIKQNKPLVRGDKITDRYGGKGVISRVLPDNMMPHYYRKGQWLPVDVCYSKCTCINRLNDGQLFETSITSIGMSLVDYMIEHELDYDQCFKLIYDYINLLNPDQAKELATMYDFTYEINDPSFNEELYNRDLFIESIKHAGNILVSIPPISCNISIDTLDRIYKAFPFLDKFREVCAPMEDSNGNYRMVRGRRKVTIGYKYIFRLKQLAEEKFSSVSLASTNIRNENSKSRLSKTHNARFSSTPVRVYGEMESSTLSSHLGIDNFYEEFMLSSSSPMARRQHQSLLMGEPFVFDVKINEDCTSQAAEIGQAYLKTLGLRYRFIKLRKFKKRPVLRSIVTIKPRKQKNVIYQLSEEQRKDKDAVMKEIDKMREEDNKKDKRPVINVVSIIPGVAEENERERKYKEKLKRLGLENAK